MVFLGGLGVMRVGHMWTPEGGGLSDYPGWDNAPEKTYAGDPFQGGQP